MSDDQQEPHVDGSASAPKPRLQRIADGVETWLRGSPLAKLAASFWIVLSGVGALVAFVESHFCAPHRAAAQLREQALREGWYDDPKVWVSYALGDCRIVNRDVRPIHEVALVRYAFRIDLGRPCAESSFFGGGTRARASVLGPGQQLAEDPAIGPPVQEWAKVALPPDCPADHDCLAVMECRAIYHRAADLKRYTRSGWTIAEPATHLSLTPVEDLLEIVQLEGQPRPRWRDDRYRRAFECVDSQVADRGRMEDLGELLYEAPGSLIPSSP